MASEPKSRLLDPKRETGAAPEAWGRASAKQTVTVRGQGAFEEDLLSSPRANSTCSLPGNPALLRRGSLTTEKGQPSQGHATC